MGYFIVPSPHNINTSLHINIEHHSIFSILKVGKKKRDETRQAIRLLELGKCRHLHESLESFFISEPCKTSHSSLYFLFPWRFGRNTVFFFGLGPCRRSVAGIKVSGIKEVAQPSLRLWRKCGGLCDQRGNVRWRRSSSINRIISCILVKWNNISATWISLK